MLIDKLGYIYNTSNVNESSHFLLVPHKIEQYYQFRLPVKNMSIYTNAIVEGEGIVHSGTNENLYTNSKANSIMQINLNDNSTYCSIYSGKNLVYFKKNSDNKIYAVSGTKINGRDITTNGLLKV